MRWHRIIQRGSVGLVALAALLFLAEGTDRLYLAVLSLSMLIAGIVGSTLCNETPFLFYLRRSPQLPARQRKAAPTAALLERDAVPRIAESSSSPRRQPVKM